MSGPAHAGLFLYAHDVERVAGFYQTLLGLARVRNAPGLVVLGSPGLQLVVSAMPAEIAATVTLADPPTPRTDTALKFFFTVPELAAAEALASALGGGFLPGRWQNPVFVACNAVDPEGNLFQLRERTA